MPRHLARAMYDQFEHTLTVSLPLAQPS